MTCRPKNIKELVKLFSSMQEFSVQHLEIDGIIIQSRSPLGQPQTHTPERTPYTPTIDSAAGSVDNQYGTDPQPPPFPTTPEELEAALNNLGSDWT